jgi:hypothetical protein
MKPLILGHKSSNGGLSPPSTQHNGTLKSIWIPTNKDGVTETLNILITTSKENDGYRSKPSLKLLGV